MLSEVNKVATLSGFCFSSIVLGENRRTCIRRGHKLTVSVLLECCRVMSDSLSAATFKCRASERCLFHKWPQSRLNAELRAATDQMNSVITNGPAIPRQPTAVFGVVYPRF